MNFFFFRVKGIKRKEILLYLNERHPTGAKSDVFVNTVVQIVVRRRPSCWGTATQARERLILFSLRGPATIPKCDAEAS